eukprot:TRINITY_DN9325_c0_g1_i3.p1 TRINITY_DN9325_c0_g1~~TRINITY_DN9325_c0_g1_i3.p1  ORF type:complete len:111 (+),score=7.80 TRINITY_DN9325_c0_g1_i3:317-649(+)
MENNPANSRGSRRSASSTTGMNHNQETRGSNNIANNVFVNHALTLWNERRREWVGTRPRQRTQQPREPVISWSTTYEDLLATSRPFPQPVPLPEMVDFLVDVWQQEGLYE